MSIRKQSTLIFISSLVQLVFGMAAGVIIGRLLGPAGKGIPVLVFNLPSLISSLGSLSIGEASTYFIGRGVDRRRVVSNTVIAAIVLGVLYAGGCLAFFGITHKSIAENLPLTFLLMGLSVIPLMLLKNYGDGMLVAMGRVNAFIAGNLLLHVSRTVFVVIALFVLKLGVAGAVGAEFASWILTGTFYVIALLRGVGFTIRIDRALARDQIRYSAITHVGNMAMTANTRVSTQILGSLSGAASVGLFSVATSTAQVLWYLPDAVGRLLFPRVASASREEANRLTPMVCRHLMFLTALACLTLLVIGPRLIDFLYRRGFEASVRPMFLLLPGILASVLNRILSKYLSGIGKPNLNSTASTISFVINIPLLFFLIGRFGVEGAAIATTIAYVVNGALMVFFFSRESGTPPWACLIPTASDFAVYPEAARSVLRRARQLLKRPVAGAKA